MWGVGGGEERGGAGAAVSRHAQGELRSSPRHTHSWSGPRNMQASPRQTHSSPSLSPAQTQPRAQQEAPAEGATAERGTATGGLAEGALAEGGLAQGDGARLNSGSPRRSLRIQLSLSLAHRQALSDSPPRTRAQESTAQSASSQQGTTSRASTEGAPAPSVDEEAAGTPSVADETPGTPTGEECSTPRRVAQYLASAGLVCPGAPRKASSRLRARCRGRSPNLASIMRPLFTE